MARPLAIYREPVANVSQIIAIGNQIRRATGGAGALAKRIAGRWICDERTASKARVRRIQPSLVEERVL